MFPRFLELLGSSGTSARAGQACTADSGFSSSRSLKPCLCVGWSSTFSSQISGLFANSRSLPYELLLLQLCTRAAGVTCRARLCPIPGRASLQASLTTSGCLPEKPLVSAEGTEALSPCCLSEKAAFTPKLQAVNCESRDLWRGEWQRCTVVASPPFFFFFFSPPHGVRRALPTLVRTIWPPQAGTSCWSRG